MKSLVRFATAVCATTCFSLGAWSASSASGQTDSSAPPRPSVAAAPTPAMVMIPGPLRSFLRMAGISQQVSLAEVLPLLARNVEIQGYHGSQEKPGSPTEFLILLQRYVSQARQLQALAGQDGVIHVAGCPGVGPLLQIIGYRFRGSCEKDPTLETDDSERAFVTIDSGFPLSQLESDLRRSVAFSYPFSGVQVPAIYTPREWTAYDKNLSDAGKDDLLDALLHNRILSRLYWGVSQVDDETRETLRDSPGVRKLLRVTAALDFYGSRIQVRSGRVQVPGGAAAEPAWRDLVGANPDSPGNFIEHLLEKDAGWMAAYYDALARVNQTQQAYFADPRRLRVFYEALRGDDTSPTAIGPVFRPDAGPLLLMTLLQVDGQGEPEVPGNLEVWQEILRRKTASKIGRHWVDRTSHLQTPLQLVEAMFAFSRQEASDDPLRIYLTLAAMDRGRAHGNRLTPESVRQLAGGYSRFSDQYLIFSEFPALTNDSILRFLKTIEELDRTSNAALRANAIGMFQANVGLWQILARQDEISTSDLNESWQGVIHPFAKITSPDELFTASRTSLRVMSKAAADRTNLSQDEFIDILAGPNQTSLDGRQVRQELANRIRAVLAGQRLASLDTLFALADGLDQVAQGKQAADSLLQLAGELREFELPRAIFTNGEREEWAPGVPLNRHSALQTRTDFAKLIKSNSPKELAEARGLLASFLRDTLVGLNYAYYEPPGAQMLHNNPLFVRSHDFSGQMTVGRIQTWQTPALFGAGLPAAGGGYLAGSLANLPFVLAKVEQDFIVPENVQALIWPELAPGLLSSAVVPRWWGVSRTELHAVTLYQRTGEELITAAAQDPTLRQAVLNILSGRLSPERSERVQEALATGHVDAAMAQILPGDTFYLAGAFRERFPNQTSSWGTAGHELESLALRYPEEVSWGRLSKDFGVPHPALAQTYARGLLDVQLFPALMGYGSLLLAESWDSSNLYFARLADEMGYAPAMLNRIVPQLTYRMIEKIFATDFEDWPAIQRAMRETGQEFREGKLAALPHGGPS